MNHRFWLLALLIVALFTAFAPPSAQAQDWDLAELIDVAARDIDEFWWINFLYMDLPYDTPEIVLFDAETVRSGCGTASQRIGPFYCTLDNTMYLPQDFMQLHLDRIGDFSVVIILAHEWGHAVQNQWNTLSLGLSIERELQADCFAGAYARHAARTSRNVRLDPGDVEEGMTALFYAGDADTAWFDPQAHGTSEQRVASYQRGLQGGFSACQVI